MSEAEKTTAAMSDEQQTCKCCLTAASPFASIDANRSASYQTSNPFPPSELLITYWRCRACGFIFTADMDSWSSSRMQEVIYNDSYILADPDFAGNRPSYFAGWLQNTLAPIRDHLDALDFGGGTGILADLMRQRGFQRYDSYDPFFDRHKSPSDRYDLVTAFEVAEHSSTPLETFGTMLKLLRANGVLLFSTQLQPRHVTSDWWYIAPRNGHLSVYSRASLAAIAHRHDAKVLTIGDGLHVMYRRPSDLVCLICHPRAPSILYAASMAGAAAWWEAVCQLRRMGSHPYRIETARIARCMRAAIMGPVK